MKKFFVFAFAILMSCITQINAVELDWSGADKIVNSIEKHVSLPKFIILWILEQKR